MRLLALPVRGLGGELLTPPRPYWRKHWRSKMAQCDVNYPTDFPIGCFQNAITIITTGAIVEREKELEVAAYNILGYGLRTLRGIPQPIVRGSSGDEAAVMKNLIDAIEEQPKRGAIDNQFVLQTLLTLIVNILKQVLGL